MDGFWIGLGLMFIAVAVYKGLEKMSSDIGAALYNLSLSIMQASAESKGCHKLPDIQDGFSGGNEDDGDDEGEGWKKGVPPDEEYRQ